MNQSPGRVQIVKSLSNASRSFYLFNSKAALHADGSAPGHLYDITRVNRKPSSEKRRNSPSYEIDLERIVVFTPTCGDNRSQRGNSYVLT